MVAPYRTSEGVVLRLAADNVSDTAVNLGLLLHLVGTSQTVDMGHCCHRVVGVLHVVVVGYRTAGLVIVTIHILVGNGERSARALLVWRHNGVDTPIAVGVVLHGVAVHVPHRQRNAVAVVVILHLAAVAEGVFHPLGVHVVAALVGVGEEGRVRLLAGQVAEMVVLEFEVCRLPVVQFAVEGGQGPRGERVGVGGLRLTVDFPVVALDRHTVHGAVSFVGIANHGRVASAANGQVLKPVGLYIAVVGGVVEHLFAQFQSVCVALVGGNLLAGWGREKALGRLQVRIFRQFAAVNAIVRVAGLLNPVEDRSVSTRHRSFE